jgi:hypothetical protein
VEFVFWRALNNTVSDRNRFGGFVDRKRKYHDVSLHWWIVTPLLISVKILKKSFQQTKYESPSGIANYQLEGPNSNTEGHGPWTTANLNP